jgi:hypothetical protein
MHQPNKKCPRPYSFESNHFTHLKTINFAYTCEFGNIQNRMIDLERISSFKIERPILNRMIFKIGHNANIRKLWSRAY